MATATERGRLFEPGPTTTIEVGLWWEGGRGTFGPTTTGRVVDLSADGMEVVTGRGLPVGTRVLCRLTLSGGLGRLMLDARVLGDRERRSDVGVASHRAQLRFLDLSPKDRDRLSRFVFQREREPRPRGRV